MTTRKEGIFVDQRTLAAHIVKEGDYMVALGDSGRAILRVTDINGSSGGEFGDTIWFTLVSGEQTIGPVRTDVSIFPLAEED